MWWHAHTCGDTGGDRAHFGDELAIKSGDSDHTRDGHDRTRGARVSGESCSCTQHGVTNVVTMRAHERGGPCS